MSGKMNYPRSKQREVYSRAILSRASSSHLSKRPPPQPWLSKEEVVERVKRRQGAPEKD
jgi:hypothetical protein